MRRPGLVPLASALEAQLRAVAPATPLARVQRVWPQVAGDAVAARAQPVGECDGTVVLACESAMWAQELALLSPRLLQRLNEALEGGGEAFRVAALRTVVGAESPPFEATP